MTKAVNVTCPHCKSESEHTPLTSINIDREPQMRAKIQDLSCFRWHCPSCGKALLIMEPCLYHDLAGQFMVWLCEEKPEAAEFDPLANYVLRWTSDFNAFREKINILERGLDDRAIEVMKYLLLAQIKRDLDIVELLFHDLDERTMAFHFVAILSDGAEQYIAMPGETYRTIAQDTQERLFTAARDFIKIDLNWAQDALSLLHGAAE